MTSAPSRVRWHAFTMRWWKSTPAERKLGWALLWDWRTPIYGLRRQYIVRAPYGSVYVAGHTFAILDLAYTHAKVGLELDGSQHHTTTGRAQDRARTAALEQQGWLIIRWNNSTVLKRPQEVREAVRKALRGRLWWRLTHGSTQRRAVR